MDMNTLTTLATVPAIIAMVTLAKDLGLPSRLAPLVAVVLGIGLALLDGFATGVVFDLPGVLAVSGTGVLLGLSAAGLYDGAKVVGMARAKHAADTAPKDPSLF